MIAEGNCHLTPIIEKVTKLIDQLHTKKYNNEKNCVKLSRKTCKYMNKYYWYFAMQCCLKDHLLVKKG